MITVGRKALRKTMSEFGLPFYNTKTDTDVRGRYEVEKVSKGFDYCQMPVHIMEAFSEGSKKDRIATAEDLLSIKMSHFAYDIFWKKHKRDILLLKKLTKGEYNESLYLVLKDHWKKEFGNKDFLSLYKTKDEFFDDFVPKQHEHDYLHELVAYPAQPMYTSCLKDGHDVYIDKDKWNLLSHVAKVRMLKEEISVIALERWLIPSLTKEDNRFTIQQAWNYSLHKTTTRLTKGKFCDFLVENIDEFLDPLEKEMLYALEILNLKEIYMTDKINFNDFIEMVNETLEERPRWGDEWDEYDILLGDFGEDPRVEFIEQEGGGEGGAEDCHSVIKVDGVFYKVTYSYYSHHGFSTDYAEVFVVTPKEKTITVYE